MMDLVWILAHQGGWDEALYIAVPALVLLYALRRAERRARANAEAREMENPATVESDTAE